MARQDLSGADGSGAAGLNPETSNELVKRAFGAHNRLRLLDEYFVGDLLTSVSVRSAWLHVYRLLLWIDRTTNLAHCYESDKCQPGRPWYARNLAFHMWLADAMGLAPSSVSAEIDRMFKSVTRDLAMSATARVAQRVSSAEKQRAPYAGLDMPEPGDDPELEKIITRTLSGHLVAEPPPAVMATLIERIYSYVAQENKRNNLTGEGFEDTLASLFRRVSGIGGQFDLYTRPLLHEVPGFHPPRGSSKPKRPDLVLVNRTTGHRTLVTCKWSVRSDREEQFGNDFAGYIGLEAAGHHFSYVLATNEFDAARLSAACEMKHGNSDLFTDVVHVNVNGPLAAYAAESGGRQNAAGLVRMRGHVESGRLVSLHDWLAALASIA